MDSTPHKRCETQVDDMGTITVYQRGIATMWLVYALVTIVLLGIAGCLGDLHAQISRAAFAVCPKITAASTRFSLFVLAMSNTERQLYLAGHL